MSVTEFVSVIIPLHNKEQWIEGCIQSVVNQSFQNIEILIINDGSTDNSREIATAIEDERITIFDKPNGGVSSARNYGIEKSKGDYIAFVDADDEWLPKHLEVALEGFRRFDDAVLVCDDLVEIIEDKTENIHHRNLPFDLARSKDGSVHYWVIEDYLQTLKNNFFILSASSVLVRSSAIKQYMLEFSEELTHGEDINYWLQLNQVGKFVFCDYVGLYYHRVDKGSAMSQKVKKSQLVPGYFCGLSWQNYHEKDRKNIKSFLIQEYYKKAYQNRGLPFRTEEVSNHIGQIFKINKLNIVVYLLIRYCPQLVFSLYRRIKNLRNSKGWLGDVKK